ncbi:hypothetical protein [Pseudalkalibacillus hwajinpoensis]|uniref:Uncharacterized protein n=1 Tax=Guptibacillus hwajinpoensis TaxID=208199 RepID=A0A4U1MBW7_9BACL|nr:hypothetical protein [Pseudalkalibacillus hwajinpoensis]TKD68247.1 hypothetical protein FBF83_17030 [Pseudalkalibacillus hwajinpoensis]
MSYHDEFTNNIGRCVAIRCLGGTTHYGYIDHCDNDHVYLRPMNGEGDDGSGFGSYFFLGAALIAVGLASIAAYSYSPFFL